MRPGGDRKRNFVPTINNKRDLPLSLRPATPPSSPPSVSSPIPTMSPPLINDYEIETETSDDDLPRMPSSSEEEIDNPDINIGPQHEDDDSFPSSQQLFRDGSHESASRNDRFYRGQTIRARGHFMRGKYLKLEVISGEDDHCAVCNSFAPLAQNQSEVLSYELEKLLFKNAFIENRGDGFGILFNRNGGVNEWMLVCRGENTFS